MKRILFVCLGNICRSPSAEAVFKDYLEKRNLSNEYFVDSAGTSAFHEGEKADQRMSLAAQKRGYQLTSISRGVVLSDYKNFDYIIGMDLENVKNLKKQCPESFKSKIFLFTDFCKRDIQGVPDPYYGGAKGFEIVLDILEEGSDRLYQFIKKDS